jgi:hypothetical protein
MRNRLSGPAFDVGDVIDDPSSIWHGATVVAAVTRAQLLEDGVLLDVGAVGLGVLSSKYFKLPMAMTATVYGRLQRLESEAAGMTTIIEIWRDLLFLARLNGRAHPQASELLVRVGVATAAGGPVDHVFKFSISGGDHGEPVLTVLLPEED